MMMMLLSRRRDIMFIFMLAQYFSLYDASDFRGRHNVAAPPNKREQLPRCAGVLASSIVADDARQSQRLLLLFLQRRYLRTVLS